MSGHGLWSPIVDGPRKDKSAFGTLPAEVRDSIIAGLDSGQLTLDAATADLKAQGYEISRTALAAAYQKLRRLRAQQGQGEEAFGLWAPVMVDAERKDKSAFGTLPAEVRDSIIAGLDSGQLTLDAATADLKAQGYEISRTALAAAYQKLRRLRRSKEKSGGLVDLVREFRGQPSLDSFGALAKLLAAQAADALLDDEAGDTGTIKAVSRALETMAQMAKVELERTKLQIARERAGRDGAPTRTKSVADVAREAYGIEIDGQAG